MSDDVQHKEIMTSLHQVNERLTEVEIVLVKQESNLEHHVYRTDLAEANIELLRKEVEPLKLRNAMFDGALKLIGLVAALVGITAGIVKIISFF